MRASCVLAALATGVAVSAAPSPPKPSPPAPPPPPPVPRNPFAGKTQFVNPTWATKLEQTRKSFLSQGDFINAAKTSKVQQTSSFVWVSDRASLTNIDDAVAAARKAQRKTGKKQIIGLVLYDLPDRDCSAGESAGEFSSANNGLELYKTEYVTPFAKKVAAAKDVDFAIVLEPDSLANLVTNLGVEFCANAAPVYREGIAYAIANLQYPNVNLYLDAAHGGWLGWDDNLPLAAKEFATVFNLAGEGKKIRGFVTNVSNYNPFQATIRDNFTEWSHSWDESHYVTSLAPHLEAEGLPSRFIIDQGRVALPGTRAEWGEWCNVEPAGFGHAPTTFTNNTLVDALVWVKPGGESDGKCGLEGAPAAGQWFDEYAQMLVKNADPSVFKRV
ncbi:glycoside hydrolase [Dichotomopilus funicola]|uniref:Glucanase n=1 Tax=Dichotomopilus funicola TaxID=1934379 RepID=A0AAN6UVJ9_9PEZI|nr:glycoside hydrolase [Dichotomopilus funicola]